MDILRKVDAFHKGEIRNTFDAFTGFTDNTEWPAQAKDHDVLWSLLSRLVDAVWSRDIKRLMHAIDISARIRWIDCGPYGFSIRKELDEKVVVMTHITGSQVTLNAGMVPPTLEGLNEMVIEDAVNDRGAQLKLNGFELRLHTKFPQDVGPNHAVLVNLKGFALKVMVAEVCEQITAGASPKIWSTAASAALGDACIEDGDDKGLCCHLCGEGFVPSEDTKTFKGLAQHRDGRRVSCDNCGLLCNNADLCGGCRMYICTPCLQAGIACMCTFTVPDESAPHIASVNKAHRRFRITLDFVVTMRRMALKVMVAEVCEEITALMHTYLPRCMLMALVSFRLPVLGKSDTVSETSVCSSSTTVMVSGSSATEHMTVTLFIVALVFFIGGILFERVLGNRPVRDAGLLQPAAAGFATRGTDPATLTGTDPVLEVLGGPRRRTVATQSQCVYMRWRAQPRFHVLSDREIGAWVE